MGESPVGAPEIRMDARYTNPDTSPLIRYLRESGEAEVIPCSSADAVHMETLRLRVNDWLGRPEQLGVGFFSRIVSEISTYFGLAVVSLNRRKFVMGLRFTDGAPSDSKAPKSVSWNTRLKNVRAKIMRQYSLGSSLPGFPIPYPDHVLNGYKGWHGRRLKLLVEKERQICWHQRIVEANQQFEFTPLHESESALFERLNRLSELDLSRLFDLARDGWLFTTLAAELGISAGGWIFLCDRCDEFKTLDFDLYLMAIEPRIQAWANEVNSAREELSAIAKISA